MRRRGIAIGAGWALAFATSCAVLPDFSLQREEQILTAELTATETACLAAETAAHHCSAVDPDPQRPRARALRLPDGSYRVEYERTVDGSFLPRANGHFVREHLLAGASRLDRGAIADSPLGRIEFVPAPATAPRKEPAEGFRWDIASAGPHRSTVTVRSWGNDLVLARQRVDYLRRLLGMAAALGHGMRLARDGDDAGAIALLDACCTEHRAGFSSMHDPLVALAYVVKARLHAARNELAAARQAASCARLLVPDSVSLTLLRGQLQERMAEPDRVVETLARAANLATPGGAPARALAFVHEESRQAAALLDSVPARLAQSTRSLEGEDFAAASRWANRALDASPGNPDALTRLADARDGLGLHTDAHALRLMALQASAATPELVLALAAGEERQGDPALGLRWLLRHHDQLPELLSRPEVIRLARAAGWEHALRVLRTEQLPHEVLPLALAWARSSQDPRVTFVARVLATEALRAGPKPVAEVPAAPLPDPTFGASGVRPTVLPAAPPR